MEKHPFEPVAFTKPNDVRTRTAQIAAAMRASLEKNYSMYPILDLEELVHKSTTPREHAPRVRPNPPVLVVLARHGQMIHLVRRYLDRAVQMHGLGKHGPLDITTAAPLVTQLAEAAGYEVRFVELEIHFHMHDAIRQIQEERVIAGITVDAYGVFSDDVK